MQYTILRSTKLEELVDFVNQRIAEGWLPLGGVSASIAVGNAIFCQAMTKDRV
jgi:hypothetical protein